MLLQVQKPTAVRVKCDDGARRIRELQPGQQVYTPQGAPRYGMWDVLIRPDRPDAVLYDRGRIPVDYVEVYVSDGDDRPRETSWARKNRGNR